MAMQFSHLQGQLKLNEPLSKYTSWRVGGAAKQLYRPKDVQDLAVFLSQLPANEPLLWIGLGSNTLVRDAGFDGTVISTAGALQQLEITGNKVFAEAGVFCSKLAKQAAKAALSGAAFFAGIPGTVGGALAMNAGAHQAETWDDVASVTTINRQGQIQQRQPDEFSISYRQVKGHADEWFVSATFILQHSDANKEANAIKALLRQRNASQPANQPTAGSVFRNPEGDYAGRLIEATGLKGFKVGGAQVSEKHANFIVSDSACTAADIENLMATVQQKVNAEHGVMLQTEVHIIGESA